VYIHIHLFLKIEGRDLREPVGGGRRNKYIFLFLYSKGRGRQEQVGGGKMV